MGTLQPVLQIDVLVHHSHRFLTSLLKALKALKLTETTNFQLQVSCNKLQSFIVLIQNADQFKVTNSSYVPSSFFSSPNLLSVEDSNHRLQSGFFKFKQLSAAWLNNSWTCFNSFSGHPQQQRRQISFRNHKMLIN